MSLFYFFFNSGFLIGIAAYKWTSTVFWFSEFSFISWISWILKSRNLSAFSFVTCSNAFYFLINMYNVRRCITTDAAKVMVHTMIISKLNYCNAILYGLPLIILSYLQSVQNTTARFITQTRKYNHIKPVLKDLPWLPIKSRLNTKFCLWFTSRSMVVLLCTSENYSARDLTGAQEHMKRTAF